MATVPPHPPCSLHPCFWEGNGSSSLRLLVECPNPRGGFQAVPMTLGGAGWRRRGPRQRAAAWGVLQSGEDGGGFVKGKSKKAQGEARAVGIWQWPRAAGVSGAGGREFWCRAESAPFPQTGAAPWDASSQRSAPAGQRTVLSAAFGQLSHTLCRERRPGCSRQRSRVCWELNDPLLECCLHRGGRTT